MRSRRCCKSNVITFNWLGESSAAEPVAALTVQILLFGNGEPNVAFHDATSIRAMRVELFQEHLATDTSGLDDGAAQRLFRQIADENRERHDRGDPNWQGLAFRLDVATYGQQAQF